ncbi:MAG: Gfo/Idh/MocA family oxidoreductase [Burkholderiales bacterium]|nr:Gfo/Idh/MocA family oxidoreductase [Burkholderiales bacterium]
MSRAPLRLGVAGLGRAFTLMLPTLAADERVTIVAATDPFTPACERLAREFGARIHPNVEALAADPGVDAIYVATPHQMHAAHIALAAAGGKHVLVEKPLAISLSECDAIIAATSAAGVHLIVGPSHSFDAPVLAARALIESGEFGSVRMLSAQMHTDFLYRPRRPEELDTAQGGGVVFSQGAHQIDIVRLLAGGLATTVRAHTGNWDPARPTEGAYAGLIGFAGGAFASVLYSGYGHYDSDEAMGWVTELGGKKNADNYQSGRARLAAVTDAADEMRRKAARNYGGADYVPGAKPAHHEHFGSVLIACERGDLRLTPDGVAIYGSAGRRTHSLPPPIIPRKTVIDELTAAIFDGVPPLHDGAWSRATLEVCLALLESGRSCREVALTRQVALARPVSSPQA